MLENFFSENNFFSITILIFLVIFALSISEFLKEKNKKTHEEILRKIPHIIIGVIFSLLPIFMTKKEIVISAVILFLGIWAGKYSKLFNSVFSIKRITLGMWMTPISLGIMSWIWLPENKTVFIVGMLILAISDALAAIFGRLYGKKKLPWTKKTFIGSFSFFISSFIILWVFSKNLDILKISLISLFLTFWEIILIFGLDNLFIPIISSYLFYYFLI